MGTPPGPSHRTQHGQVAGMPISDGGSSAGIPAFAGCVDGPCLHGSLLHWLVVGSELANLGDIGRSDV